jgi:hypothetical protein
MRGRTTVKRSVWTRGRPRLTVVELGVVIGAELGGRILLGDTPEALERDSQVNILLRRYKKAWQGDI